MENQPVTLDSLMADFVCDMTVADDELSESIFSCVDNFIDDLCLRVMDDENSVFETDRDEGDLPFNYILDKVMERVDTICGIADDAYGQALAKQLGLKGDEYINSMDPDYCEDINFGDIDPEDFQLYIPNPANDEGDEERPYWATDDGTNVDSSYDSIFNA
jgi:hypothetical protein